MEKNVNLNNYAQASSATTFPAEMNRHTWELPAKMAEQVNSVLTSSHDRIKITLNYRTDITGTRLKSG